MKAKNRVKQILNLWRLVPAYLCVCCLPKRKREIVKEEIYHWNKCGQKHEKKIFNIFSRLMLENKEYRNLVQYRAGGGYSLFLRLLFPPMDTLFIVCRDIGPRLYIQHGFSTYIAAKSIGSDCWINQQVTIGYTFDKEPPVIGNGVRISAGAKVVGQITLGDNSIVAANAAVVKDVPEDMVMGGVPAKIIGQNTEHKLYLKG